MERKAHNKRLTSGHGRYPLGVLGLLRRSFRFSQKGADQVLKGSKILGDGVKLFNQVMDFLANLASVGVGVFALAGTSSAGRKVDFVFDVNASALPLRLFVLILISAAMGWGLGALVGFLSVRKTEARGVLSLLAALAMATLLVLSADWLAVPTKNTALPELFLFTVIGLGLALWIARFQFSQRLVPEASVLMVRAQALFGFVVVSLGVLMLTVIGAG